MTVQNQSGREAVSKLIVMKKTLLPLVPLIALAGCSAASGGGVGEIEDVTEIRDALAGTDYECNRWDEVGRLRSCGQYGNGEVQFSINDDPELYAALLLDEDYPETDEVIVGENWAGRCVTPKEGTCQAIADILGGWVKAN